MTTMKRTRAAFANTMIPFARVLVRAFAFTSDEDTREAVRAARRLMPYWLKLACQDLTFAAALGELIAESFVGGLGFEQPAKASLAQILERSRSREILPTSLSSRELVEQYGQPVLQQAIFSARTTSAAYLGELADVLDDFLAGKINKATARMRLLKKLDQLGYDPETGFPGDKEIPPAERGSLRDLSSDRRIDLILNTQAELAFGKGQQIAGLETLAIYPGWELVRIAQRKNHRLDWNDRFVRAGGVIVEGRLIAHKLSEVWPALGSRALFDDALDIGYPPFVWGSGKGWESVDAPTMQRLGITADGVTPPELPQPGQPLTSTKVPEGLPADIAAQLAAELASVSAEAHALFRRDLAETLSRGSAE